MTKSERQMEKANQIQQSKNWWTTGRFDISLEDKQKAQALNAAKEADRLKRYDDQQKQKEGFSLANKKLDAETTTAEATLADANAVAQAKNQNALQVAAIRSSGSALGRKDPSVLSAKDEGELAQGLMKQDPGLPGKPGISYEDALAKVRTSYPGGGTAVPKYNADGTAAVNTPQPVQASDTLSAQQRQELVPGLKNPSLGESMRVPAGQLGITTPKGEAPSALSANQWQQYADSKSPGMKYEGNQPGMIGDQIARFKRPDGSAFFANTGAAKMQMGDALTPATPNAPLDNTPGAAPRATMPDAANRSTMNMAGIPKVKDPSIAARLSQDFKGAMSNFASALEPTRPEDITDRENAQPINAHSSVKNFLGANTDPLSAPAVEPDTSSTPIRDLTSWYTKNAARNMPGYKARETKTGHSVATGRFEQENALPNGFMSWLKSWNKRKTSTNPLFPNYAQE